MAVPEKYSEIDFKPPKSVADTAAKGLEYRQKASPSNKGGLTPAEASKEGIGSGVQRAVNLKNRDNISPEVIRQMVAFFARHEKNKTISADNKSTPWNDKGYVAWLIWGGDPGRSWAEKVRDMMDTADKKSAVKKAARYPLRSNSPYRVASKYILSRIPTDESKQYKKDESDRQKHIKGAQREFVSLVKILEPLSVQAKKEFPGRDQLSIQRRGKVVSKLIRLDPHVAAYLDKWVGGDSDHPAAYSWRNSMVYVFRDVLVFGMSFREAYLEIEKQVSKGFEAITMSQAQAPLRKVIPADLLEFMPKNIVVDIDESGAIQHITDKFENEHLTLGKKIERMKDLVRKYNVIAKKVKQDLKSSNEILKLSALVTAIIMETGIRPGKEGNGVVKTVDGESVDVETFGAVTLGPSHIRFIRDNFVELEFLGKKGSVNTARLGDAEIIKILKDYTQKALQSGSKYVFVTKAGVEFSYADLQRYFRENFDGFAPTDFRKLRATEALLEALRLEQDSLYARLREFASDEKEEVRTKIVSEIVLAFKSAIAQAQTALSHDDSSTTISSYINPEIVLRFLSTGRVDDTLESAILTGKTTLSFRPEAFLAAAGISG